MKDAGLVGSRFPWAAGSGSARRLRPVGMYCYGRQASWRLCLESLHRDGVLPLEQVLWLLDIVQHEEMRLPTAEELEKRGHKDFDEAHGVEGWHRLLKRRRRRLVKFLQIAVHLEEDLRKGFA